MPDRSLIGSFNLVKTLIRKDPSLKSECLELVDELFFNCLFALPTAEDRGPPKCKTQVSRETAFRLLIELADEPNNFLELSKFLLSQIDRLDTLYEWSYNPIEFQKSPTGFVGLLNLGATCYMNSLLQQLYIIPQFREGILIAKDNSPNPAESLLFQLQYLFSYLQVKENLIHSIFLIFF